MSVPPRPWIIYVVLVLSAAAVALVGVVTYLAVDTRSSTHVVEESSTLAACRDQAAAKVADARTDFDVARAERDTAATRRDSAIGRMTTLTNEGLVAAVQDDDATLSRVITDLAEARRAVTDGDQAVLDAEAVVIERTVELRSAGRSYRDLVRLSRENPRAFLDWCGVP